MGLLTERHVYACECHTVFLFSQAISIPPTITNSREYYVSNELLKRGHKITWATRVAPKKIGSKEKIKVINLARSPSRFDFSILSLINLYKFLLVGHANVVWINGWYSRSISNLLLLVFLLKLLRKKIVYDPIDPIIEYDVASFRLKRGSLEEKLLQFLMWVVYQLADLTLVVTEDLKEILVKKGVNDEKTHVAYYGTDRNRFNLLVDGSEIRKTLDLESAFAIGWIGAMSPFKGISEIIVPLIKSIRRSVSSAVFLIGGQGELEKEFIKVTKDPEMPLIYLGVLPHKLAPFYTAAFDVYIVPLNTELEFARSIYPGKLLDALATGTPTVVTSTPATRRLSQAFKSITLVENSPEAFENAITKIERDYEKIKSFAIHDAQNVDRYAAQTVAVQIADLVENLVK